MAKVIITIQDSEDSVDVKASFKPILEVKSPTPAQELAIKLCGLCPKIQSGELDEYIASIGE